MHGTIFSDFPGFPSFPELVGTLLIIVKKFIKENVNNLIYFGLLKFHFRFLINQNLRVK